MIIGYYYLFTYIRRLFIEILNSISNIAQGRIHFKCNEIYLQRNDELGIIVNELQSMAENLKKIIAQIYSESSASEQFAATSELLLDQSKKLESIISYFRFDE